MREVTLGGGILGPGRVVVKSVNVDSSRGNEMTYTGLKSKLAEHHRQARQQRELDRAIRSAPTLASRQELMTFNLR